MTLRTAKRFLLPLTAAGCILGATLVLAQPTPQPPPPPPNAPVPQGTMTVTGTVQDADGKPMPNVRLRLIPLHAGPTTGPDGQQPPPRHIRPAQGANQSPAGARRALLAQSNANGQFSFPNVPPGNYAVMATLQGAGAAHERITVGTQNPAPITLTLEPIKPRPNGPTTQPGQ